MFCLSEARCIIVASGQFWVKGGQTGNCYDRWPKWYCVCFELKGNKSSKQTKSRFMNSYKEMLHVLIGLNGLDLMYVYIMKSLTYTSSLYFSHSHPRPHEVGGKTEACQGAARGKGQISWWVETRGGRTSPLHIKRAPPSVGVKEVAVVCQLCHYWVGSRLLMVSTCGGRKE